MKKIAFFLLILFCFSCVNIIAQDKEESNDPVLYWYSQNVFNEDTLIISFRVADPNAQNAFIYLSKNNSERVLLQYQHVEVIPPQEQIEPEDMYPIFMWAIGGLTNRDILTVEFLYEDSTSRYVIRDEPFIIIFDNIKKLSI